MYWLNYYNEITMNYSRFIFSKQMMDIEFINKVEKKNYEKLYCSNAHLRSQITPITNYTKSLYTLQHALYVMLSISLWSIDILW